MAVSKENNEDNQIGQVTPKIFIGVIQKYLML